VQPSAVAEPSSNEPGADAALPAAEGQLAGNSASAPAAVDLEEAFAPDEGENEEEEDEEDSSDLDEEDTTEDDDDDEDGAPSEEQDDAEGHATADDEMS